MSDDSIRQEFLTELDAILESDEAYGSNIQVLTYTVKNEVINGKFKDSWNNRVYEFIIDIDGISYKPAIKLDSFAENELPVRFDTYSKGYGSLLLDVRLDRNPTGKRVKKPKCGTKTYGCGFACIGLQNTCRILSSGQKTKGNFQERAIGKERLNKLLELGKEVLLLTKKGEVITPTTIADQIKNKRSEKAGQLVSARKEKLAQRQLAPKETQLAKASTKAQEKQPAKPTSDLTTNPKTHSIKTRREFEDVFYHVVDELNKKGNYNELIPIYKIRESIGELVSRDKFNKFMIDIQGDDKLDMVFGEQIEIEPGARQNSIHLPGTGAVRSYVKLTNQGKQELQKITPTNKNKVNQLLKDRPDLDPLGTARQYTTGSKIKSQKEFESTLEKIYNSLNNDFIYNNTVPIAQVREVLKNRVSSSDFDRMIENSQDGNYRLIGGGSEVPENIKKGGIKTSQGNERLYLQREK